MFNVVKAAFHAVLWCNPLWNVMKHVPRPRWVWLVFHCVLYVPNFWCLEHFAVLNGVPWWRTLGVTFFGPGWAELHGGKVPGKIVGVTTTVRCIAPKMWMEFRRVRKGCSVGVQKTFLFWKFPIWIPFTFFFGTLSYCWWTRSCTFYPMTCIHCFIHLNCRILLFQS